MHRDMMLLVCHAADGHFADGDRQAIRRVLDWAEYVAEVKPLDTDRQSVACADGGRVMLRASGLHTSRTFHRIELYLESERWTPCLFRLVFDLMQQGGFGLMDDAHEMQFIVTQPQQVSYFPWLPQPPLLVRTAHDLEQVIVPPA